MRIDSDGNVIISKTSTSDTVTGLQTTTNGGLINVYNANGYSVQIDKLMMEFSYILNKPILLKETYQ